MFWKIWKAKVRKLDLVIIPYVDSEWVIYCLRTILISAVIIASRNPGDNNTVTAISGYTVIDH